MSQAMSIAGSGLFDERIDPGKVSSALFAAAVHLALLAVLVFGVRWQNRPPEAVSVELWEPPPAPAPRVEPPPPAPVVKPEPEIPKPDIALKAPPPKPAPKPAPKVVPKEAPKPEAVKPKADEARKRRLQQELAREQASFAIERDRQQIKDQLAREVSVAQKRDYEVYAGRIKAKIRGNIVLPPDIKGDPESIFDVVQLPTGEVLSVKLRKSSGHPGYDGAVERAILKSSPLPRPDRPDLFDRELKLTFRPKD